MVTEIKNQYYKKFDEFLQTKHEVILEKYVDKIDLIKEVIDYSLHLRYVMNAVFFEEVQKTGKKLDGPTALIPFLYDKNNHYLIAAYKLAVFGLINPSNSILRAIFEGITQIYLLYLTNNEAELYYKKQLGLLTPVEKKELKNKYHNLKPQMVRNILYCESKKKQIEDFYSVISNTTHPSIIGAMGDIGLEDEIMKDTLGGILALGSANIIAYYEIYSDDLDNNCEIPNDLLYKVSKELDGFMIDIIPNKPTYSEKLKIMFKPPNQT
ncbi:MAG: hypothetical protein O8C63_00880 [Candidatus Methanoperedens sp.]|nr:hypothetical protein [Candidatus Methanoperedens sp.]